MTNVGTANTQLGASAVSPSVGTMIVSAVTTRSTASSNDESSDDNTGLYAGIGGGVAGVILLIGLAYGATRSPDTSKLATDFDTTTTDFDKAAGQAV